MSEQAVPPQLEAMIPKSATIDFNTPPETSNLKGRSVLVTGGVSGLGLEYATVVAGAGALVTVADIQGDLGTTVAQELTSKGHKVQFVYCDVTSYTSQIDMFKKAIEFGGRKLDIVVPSAGVLGQKNLTETLPQELPTLDSPPPPEPAYNGAEINLQGVYNTCYLALHYFRLPRQENDTFKKAIVLISSLAGYIGYPSSSTYSVSKFGVRGIFYDIRDAASKLDPPVRVNLVGPGFTPTPMVQTKEFQQSIGGMWTKLFGWTPIEEVVSVMVRCSADEEVARKSVIAVPHGNFDLEEDIWGGYGGVVLRREMGKIMMKAVQAQATQAHAEAEKKE